MRFADLNDANLNHANLCYANLCGADMHNIEMGGANLHCANLVGAQLIHANLGGTNLYCANMTHANLYGADLIGADLHGASLCNANMLMVNTRGTNLYAANTRGVIGIENLRSQFLILPEGVLIGYKKANTCDGYVIITLEIPVDAKRSNVDRKCRTSKAIVKNIEGIGFEYKGQTVHSHYSTNFIYEVGKIVEPTEPFEENWTIECASGIHFFITRQEAENY